MTTKFFKFIDETEKIYGNNVLIDDNTGYTLTIDELKKNILFFGLVLKKTGIKSSDKICLFAENHPNYIVFEQALLNINATCVPRGSKNPISELEYIYKDSFAIGIITDSIKVVNHFVSINDAHKNTKFILYFGNEENLLPQDSIILKCSDFDVPQKLENSNLCQELETEKNQTAFILYTSGTSGFPKGAMIKSSSIDYQVKALQNRFKVDPNKTFLCLHPLWHSGSRIYNMFLIESGCNIVYTCFKNYIRSIKKYSPDYLHSVPKAIYEICKEYKNILSQANIIYKLIFKLCFALSLKYKQAIRLVKNQNAVIPKPNIIDYVKSYIQVCLLYFIHLFANNFFYIGFRRKLLKDNLIIFTGAAKLSNYVEDLFDVIGIKIIGGYGLTETSPLLTHDNLEKHKYYSAGFPLQDTEIKIIDLETFENLGKNQTGMIIAKGPQIMTGYYNKDEETKKIFMPEGFLKTGDIGWLSEDNHLTIISRYDDTIVLSNGSNVNTLFIEEECLKCPLVDQLIFVGNAKLYISALCSVNNDEYYNWCIKNNMDKKNPNNNFEFKKYFLSQLNDIITKRKNFIPYEKIKNVFFIDEPFSAENGLMTNTSKLKRIEINKTYMEQINRMYNDIER